MIGLLHTYWNRLSVTETSSELVNRCYHLSVSSRGGGRGDTVDPVDMVCEIAQVAYIAITVVILAKERVAV
jgi:hypothetical protein